MCEVGARLWEVGLVGAREGNLSARISDDRILCTPSGCCLGQLSMVDLVTIDRKGGSSDGRVPSSEIGIHLRAYDRREDCRAVVHAHPLTATGFSVACADFPDNVLPESAMVLGRVMRLPYAVPGSPQVADGLDPYLADHKTFLLSNHGAMTLGLNLYDACDRMETLERVAKILFVAKSLGNVNPMPETAFESLAATALTGRLD